MDAADPHERRMLEFAALYYAMNLASRSAELARHAGDSGRLARANALLDELTAKRDALEDLSARAGFVADPVFFTDGRCIDIRFTWPDRPRFTSLFAQRFSAMVRL